MVGAEVPLPADLDGLHNIDNNEGGEVSVDDHFLSVDVMLQLLTSSCGERMDKLQANKIIRSLRRSGYTSIEEVDGQKVEGVRWDDAYRIIVEEPGIRGVSRMYENLTRVLQKHFRAQLLILLSK